MTMDVPISKKQDGEANAKSEGEAPGTVNGCAMPLPMLRPGQPACVECIRAAGQAITRKLSAMGIVHGAHVMVLNSQPGPLMLRVGEGRYAIGRGMAQHILVTPCQ